MIKVLFSPDYTKGNPYQFLLKNALKEYGCSVEYSGMPQSSFPLNGLVSNHPECKILHIHWLAEILQRMDWSRNQITFYIKCLFLVIDCVLVRIRGYKIIWTIHNKIAHQNFNKPRELLVRKIIYRFSNHCIVHSELAIKEISKAWKINIEDKTHVIFHGNYDGYYPIPSNNKEGLRATLNIDGGDVVFLYFGIIRPYKGLETLIKSFQKNKPENTRLIIAGNCPNIGYKEKIEKLIQNNDQIIFDNRFVPNQDLSDYLYLSDAVVIPFTNTLTSGSVILAMTFGKALILPENARVFGLLPDDGVLFFKSNEDLAALLSTSKNLNYKKLGEINFIQSNKRTWSKAAKLTKDVYDL